MRRIQMYTRFINGSEWYVDKSFPTKEAAIRWAKHSKDLSRKAKFGGKGNYRVLEIPKSVQEKRRCGKWGVFR